MVGTRFSGWRGDWWEAVSGDRSVIFSSYIKPCVTGCDLSHWEERCC